MEKTRVHRLSDAGPEHAPKPATPGPQPAGSAPKPAPCPTFLLVVISAPFFFPGEVACLEGLLSAGVQKLHLRKPAAKEAALEALLLQIDSRWYSRLVLHGSDLHGLASKYGIPQVHCPLTHATGQPSTSSHAADAEPHGPCPESPATGSGLAISASLHNWDEMKSIEAGALSYALMSPVFDSISKPGYTANPGLLQRPPCPHPCRVIGMGGVDDHNIGRLVQEGWDGAAILGYIWKQPEAVVQRYERLKKMITDNL